MGHSDNLEFSEFSEFSEFLNSKIPSSKLSLFSLYGKTITRNFSRVWDFHFESKIPSSELSLFALYQKTITRNFFLRAIFTLKAKFRVTSYRYLPYTKKL